MICDIKFATVSQSENITIGPEEKQREFDPKPRFLGKKFYWRGTHPKLTPADNLLACAALSAKRSRIPSLPIFAWDGTVWGLANVS
jgi:hypothetical protein